MYELSCNGKILQQEKWKVNIIGLPFLFSINNINKNFCKKCDGTACLFLSNLNQQEKQVAQISTECYFLGVKLKGGLKFGSQMDNQRHKYCLMKIGSDLLSGGYLQSQIVSTSSA